MPQKKNKNRKTSTDSMLKTVRKVFDKTPFEYEFDKENKAFIVSLEPVYSDMHLLAIVHDDAFSLVCRLGLDGSAIPNEKLLPVLNRINSRLTYGAFYRMDQDSDVAFEYGYPFKRTGADEKFVRSMISVAVGTASDHRKEIIDALEAKESSQNSMYC